LAAGGGVSERTSVAIIGAGPAGLTAAYVLARRGIPVTVLEADPQYVGGISRTVEHDGFRFDIGGHRFFTKAKAIDDLWTDILPDGFIVKERLSRIFYAGKFFAYPLKPLEALRKIGPAEALACLASYGWARLRPIEAPANFEEWIVNRFGRRLFEIFFKSYTEKVWGMPCDQISADWAAQRIGRLSLGSAMLPEWWLSRRTNARGNIKTLTTTFRYPRHGPGMVWNACAAAVRSHGGEVRLGTRVHRCTWADGGWEVESVDSGGGRTTTRATNLISSAAMPDLVASLEPAPTAETRRAAAALKYRDFLTVGLALEGARSFPDQWIYIHDPSVRVGRIQNYGAWSVDMVPHAGAHGFGLEYFGDESDELWRRGDEELVALAWSELRQIGLAVGARLLRGYVMRQPRAYPVYDPPYAGNVDRIRRELEARFPTLHLVGRNGMHRYNNQDHAMMTGMLAAENIIQGGRAFDVWRVNADAVYLEETETAGGTGTALRIGPTPVASRDRL
jgi:protoporphyrinogen oxidase